MLKSASIVIVLCLAVTLLAVHAVGFPYPFYGGKFGKFGAGLGGFGGGYGIGGLGGGAYKGFYRPFLFKPYPFKYGFAYGYPYTFLF